MTPELQRVAAKLLSIASDDFARHRCNDFDLAEVMPDIDDRRMLMRDYHLWNGDNSEIDHSAHDYRIVPDFVLMRMLALKLSGEIADGESATTADVVRARMTEYLRCVAVNALEAMRLIQGHCGDYVYDAEFQQAINDLECAIGAAQPPL